MQAQRVGELLHFRFGNFDGWAEFGILRVLERNDSVEPVVAPGQLHDDEDRVFRSDRAGSRRSHGRAAQERRHAQAPGDQAGVSQEFATSLKHDLSSQAHGLQLVGFSPTETPAMLALSGRAPVPGDSWRRRQSHTPARQPRAIDGSSWLSEPESPPARLLAGITPARNRRYRR